MRQNPHLRELSEADDFSYACDLMALDVGSHSAPASGANDVEPNPIPLVVKARVEVSSR